jgi:16S rRNA (guanine527-N7)-methyltransferase
MADDRHADFAAFRQRAAALGVALDPETAARLHAYLDLLRRWNRVFNLTAITEQQAMVSKHLLDCLACLPYVRRHRVADVGSGAGTPGLVWAITEPGLQCTLVEPKLKRVNFLRQVCIELGIANVELIRGRIEDVAAGSRFDTIASRGFGDLASLLRATAHLRGPGVRLLAMKGQLPAAELQVVRALGVQPEVVVVTIPGLAEQRHLIVIEG